MNPYRVDIENVEEKPRCFTREGKPGEVCSCGYRLVGRVVHFPLDCPAGMTCGACCAHHGRKKPLAARNVSVTAKPETTQDGPQACGRLS